MYVWIKLSNINLSNDSKLFWKHQFVVPLNFTAARRLVIDIRELADILLYVGDAAIPYPGNGHLHSCFCQ